MSSNKNFIIAILGLLLISLSITSCKRDMNVAIDNPTGETINFTIDGNLYEIEAYQLRYFTLESGKHNLQFNKEEQEFTLIWKKGKVKYMLNPTQSNYVIHEVVYGESKLGMTIEHQDKLNRVLNEKHGENNILIDTISFDIFGEQVSLAGLYRKTNDLLIEKIWQYNVNEPLPEQIKVETTEIQRMAGVQAGRIKIYREADFISTILKEL